VPLAGHDAVRTLDQVSVAPAPPVTLDGRCARELVETALSWRAEETPDPRSLVTGRAARGRRRDAVPA
jgi:hypothetical protein